jgi:xanthine/CO dehydrogenase XdhC/CoxF family maturation factor
VKHWQELGQILDRVLHLAREGRPAALAIVTRIRGSAYRRPGAKLLVEDDGSLLGGVSGGCLEEDVRQVGLEVIRSGVSRVRHYETGGDDTKVWGLGLGCDGEVDVAVQPVTVAAVQATWGRVRGLLDQDVPFALSTVVGDGAAGQVLAEGEWGRLAGAWRGGRSRGRSGGRGGAAHPPLEPPPRRPAHGLHRGPPAAPEPPRVRRR